MAKKQYASPDKDAGWGLIYRLNNLWGQVDPKATKGDYDDWNFVLDRIYCNLLYANEMVIKRIYQCDKGHKFSTFNKKKECPTCIQDTGDKTKIRLIRIESIALSDEDEMIYKFLTKQIRDANNAKLKAIRKPKGDLEKGMKSLEECKEIHYRALMMKDIWVRKFMQELGLYLKVSHNDPSGALFGSN